MRRIFSEYNYMLKLFCKRLKCGSDYKNPIYRIKSDIERAEGDAKKDLMLGYERLRNEYWALNGGATHYFIEGEGMEEWLIASAPRLNQGSFNDIINAPNNTSLCFLHFEGKGSKSKLFRFCENTEGHKAVMVSTSFSFKDGMQEDEDVMIRFYDHEKCEDPIIKSRGKLLAGFLAYVSCFPDQIKDGVPCGIIHPNHMKHRICKTVSCDHMKEHGLISPHFRSGHFRVLSSERFTKKRFQVIFIKECFVKGEAKTVEGIV